MNTILLQLPSQQVANELLSHLNFQHSLGYMDLIISISAQLSDKKEFAALCIKSAISSSIPARTIIATTKDMIQDNYNGMADMLGMGLTDRIKNFEI